MAVSGMQFTMAETESWKALVATFGGNWGRESWLPLTTLHPPQMELTSDMTW